MTHSLRVAIIGSSRFPIAQPFAGGLESHVWHLTRALIRRGHAVTLFAGPGSDHSIGASILAVDTLVLSDGARSDVAMPPTVFMAEHHAYLSLMMDLSGPRRGEFDVVHNHSLHYLPLAMSPAMQLPMVSTLHTPPTPWLESALAIKAGMPVRFVAVSAHSAQAWLHATGPIDVVSNGVDTDVWRAGPGGGDLIWFGRLVEEKGAHLAIAAARLAGRPIDLAGPIMDRTYFERRIAPQLDDTVRYLGHLNTADLAAAVGRASVAVVTPTWDEPYGLVVAESLACGTPVAAFARGGIPEIVSGECARLVPGDDLDALAVAITEAAGLSRAATRAHAVEHCSIDAMVDRYEIVYRESIAAT